MPRRFRRTYRRGNKRYVRTGPMGRTKRLVDGRGGQLMRAGVQAIPYLIKSVSLMKSLINSELHYLDNTANVTINNTTGQVILLTGIAQGDTDQTRNGNKILLHDMIARFHFYRNASATATNIRMMIVVDKQCDGAAPTVANILTTQSPLSPLNQDYSKRFVIVADKLFEISQGADYSKSMKIYKKFQFHTLYDGTTNGIASCKENQVFLVAISNEPTNVPGMEYDIRVKWYDN